MSTTPSLGTEVQRLVRMVHALRSKAREGLSEERAAHYLLFALGSQPLRITSLAEAVHVDPSTVSRQVAELVRQGLVERRADPVDGRASLLHLTPQGEEVHRDLQKKKDTAFLDLLAHWDPQDVKTLTHLTARLNDALENHTLPSIPHSKEKN